MRSIVAVSLSLLAGHAAAAPLTLYDAPPDPTKLAPIDTPGTASSSALTCGGVAVACSQAPAAKTTALPFDYGLAVSGMVGGGHYSGFSGEGVSGWVKPRDVPVTLYFNYQRFQPLGR